MYNHLSEASDGENEAPAHEEKEKGTLKRFLSSHLNGAQKRAGKAKPLF